MMKDPAMKKLIMFLTAFTLLASGASPAATLQNTDSQEYDLQLMEPGRPFSSPYRILSNAQVEVCFNGCEMTLLATGQTVRVKPNDAVMIDNGVMSVTPGD